MNFLSLSKRFFANASCQRGFHYNVAVVRDIDSKLFNAECLNLSLRSSLNIDLARHQHQLMIYSLQQSGISNIYSLPSDGLPDSVFVEDTAVVIGKNVLLTNPGALSRQKELCRVKEFFENTKTLMGKPLKIMNLYKGTLDGGDVLFTGREILVGLSSRTNIEGIMSLHIAFPNFAVSFYDISHGCDNTLHLKSFCSMCGENDIALGGDLGNLLQRWMKSRSYVNSAVSLLESDGGDLGLIWRKLATQLSQQSLHFPDSSYNFIQFPENERDAANCLYINKTLIRRSKAEFPISHSIFETKCSAKQIEVEGSELAKVDGALTCCSLLL